MSTVIRVRQHGGPSVLVAEDELVGDPGPGQVRLRQEAIGVNFLDTMFRSGAFPAQLPFTPGVEGAGIVQAVGPGVANVIPGDRVGYFFSPGAYAAVRLIEARALIRLPDYISYEQAAALLTKGLTAWMAVRALYRVKAAERVLVQGATGGVGSLVARWAKSLDATVFGTTGSEAKRVQLSQEVDQALRSDEPELGRRILDLEPRGMDVVYEFVGKATFNASVEAVRDGGAIVNIGAASGPPMLDKSALAARGVRLLGGSTAQFVNESNIEAATKELFDAYRTGVFGDLQFTRHLLADAARAHQDIVDRRHSGAQVLIP